MAEPSPVLRQIACTDVNTLRQAYERVADTEWVDGCVVDLTNLMIELRVTAPWNARGALESRIAQVEQIARGQARGGAGR